MKESPHLLSIVSIQLVFWALLSLSAFSFGSEEAASIETSKPMALIAGTNRGLGIEKEGLIDVSVAAGHDIRRI